MATVATTPKRDAVTRIHEALTEKGYRCSQTALANFAANALNEKRVKSGWDFSLWYGKNGSFVLWANEEKQTYELFKAIGTNTVDEDIALL
jgi:hypothetical protein